MKTYKRILLLNKQHPTGFQGIVHPFASCPQRLGNNVSFITQFRLLNISFHIVFV